MATSKSDDLAKRFADRLTEALRHAAKSPSLDRPPAVVQTLARRLGSNPAPNDSVVVPPADGSAATSFRTLLHADARRLKLAQQARRGRRVTWDDVATEALDLLLADRGEVGRRLSDVRRLSDQATAAPRLVQATIPVDLDIAFSELRLDLADELGRDVPYEQLWSAALLIWLRAHR